MRHTKTLEEFVRECRAVHGDKYDYINFEYVNNKTKGVILCKKCGLPFRMIPTNHLNNKQGCPRCNGTHKLETQEFVDECKKKYDYDYSETEYTGSNTKVKIICHKKDELGNEHGAFWKIPRKHLHGGQGCPKCSRHRKCSVKKVLKPFSIPFIEFVNRAREVHGGKYEYHEDKYTNYTSKTLVTCPKHGDFEVIPQKHVDRRFACKECRKERMSEQSLLTYEEFLRRSVETHGDKYDYSESVYKGNMIPVEIICPTHGSFWQKPVKHWIGQGCPKCNQSHLEREVERILSSLGLDFKYQATKKDLDFLGMMSLDFYLPKYNIAIECQGIQHFEDNGIFKCGKVIERDIKKHEACKDNGIKLVYYTNLEKQTAESEFYMDKECFFSENKLINYLNSYETAD